MTTVLIRPQFDNPDTGDGGIRRVVEALHRWLPEYHVKPIPENEKQMSRVCMVHASEEPHNALPLIAVSHGLYWTAEQEWAAWAWHVNKQCIENMRRANHIVAASQWVANAISRGMMRKVDVIPHGVELDEWEPAKNSGHYVFWNKARTDVVSDPTPVNQLAEQLPEIQFLSTFGDPTANVKVFGKRIPFKEMKRFLKLAGVYLSTARETFGIGILEAMASGVPVVAVNYGGASEILTHGVDGWLAAPGDLEALAEGIAYCLANRERIGEAGRETVRQRYRWQTLVGRYAELIHSAATPHAGPRTSVIVTAHNLAQYLPDTLRSVRAQTDTDWECIIVDDASTDATPAILKEAAAKDKRFRALTLEQNRGLVGARNAGVDNAEGRYILFLDADDMLAENALEILTHTMDRRPDLTVAAGHLDVVTHDAQERRRNAWPFEEYDHARQLKHINNIPYCSLIRRQHWLDAGGYRTRADRNEDAEMWCRLGSYGWKIEKVTQEPVLIYRNRAGSKSKQELDKYGSEPDWTHWFTWKDLPELMPFGSLSKPPKSLLGWPVSSYTDPKVSVIIPVGPGHAKWLPDVLDTLLAQTTQQWEAIVVNDTGEELDLRGFPFARVLHTGARGSGAGVARNVGVAAALAPLLFFLDVDDMIFPDCLRKHLVAYAEALKRGSPAIIYSDWVAVKGKEKYEVVRAFDWDCKQLMVGASRAPTMLISFLHPKALYEKVNGFDEKLPGWEDWDYHIKLALQGICGWRIPEPLMFYRMTTGQRREQAHNGRGAIHQPGSLLNTIYERYKEYYTGGKMCGCSGGATAKVSSLQANGHAPEAPLTEGDMVLAKYYGPTGKMLVNGGQTGTLYGRRSSGDVFYVHRRDVDGMRFREVTRPAHEPEIVVTPTPVLQPA